MSGFIPTSSFVDFSFFSGEQFNMLAQCTVAGAAFPVTGLTAATFIVKNYAEDTDADAILNYNMSEMYVPSGQTNSILVRMPPSDSANLIAGGVYWYELRITVPSGEEYTILCGRLFING